MLIPKVVSFGKSKALFPFISPYGIYLNTFKEVLKIMPLANFFTTGVADSILHWASRPLIFCGPGMKNKGGAAVAVSNGQPHKIAHVFFAPTEHSFFFSKFSGDGTFKPFQVWFKTKKPKPNPIQANSKCSNRAVQPQTKTHFFIASQTSLFACHLRPFNWKSQ